MDVRTTPIEVVAVMANGDVLADERSVDRFQAHLAEVCGQMNALHAELVEMIAEALRTDAWKQWGIRSIEQYVAWQTGLASGRVRQLVHAAQRKAELPVTFGAFDRGELSLDQVSAIVDHAPADVDAEVCGFAKVATVTQLRTNLARYSWKEPVKDRPARPPQDVAYGMFDERGRYHLKVDAPHDVGVVIDAALREARDALFNGGHRDVTWMDSIGEVCHRSLDTVTSPSRRDRFRIYLHIGIDDNDEHTGPRAWFNAGPSAPQWLTDLLCCNGDIRPLWEQEGTPISIGRLRHIVPERTRKAVLDRDRTCRFPGCSAKSFLEVHHITPWLAGGTSDLENLAGLCPTDHQRHHRGEFTITGNANLPDGLRFFDARGRPIVPAGTPSPPAEPPPLDKHYTHPLGERFDSRWLHFNQN